MCQKCDNRRERIEKFVNEDPLMKEDPTMAAAALVSFAVERLLEETNNNPFEVQDLIDKIMTITVARKVSKAMEDPKVVEALNAAKKSMEEQLQTQILENMPEPKVTH
jgi:hypothetical protein